MTTEQQAQRLAGGGEQPAPDLRKPWQRSSWTCALARVDHEGMHCPATNRCPDCPKGALSATPPAGAIEAATVQPTSESEIVRLACEWYDTGAGKDDAAHKLALAVLAHKRASPASAIQAGEAPVLQLVAWYDPSNKDPGQSVTFLPDVHAKWPHIYRVPLFAKKEAPSASGAGEAQELKPVVEGKIAS